MNVNDLHLRELYRFAELGRMSASLLHEISNPLSAAMLNLEMGDQTSVAVRRAQRNMQLLRRYVEAARQQIRPHSPASSFCLNVQVTQLKRMLQPLARKAGVKLVFGKLPERYKIHGDPVKFQQIVTNLVINGLQAYEHTSSSIVPVVQITFCGAAEWLTVQVQDWGKGIAAADMPKLFNMFYTTKGGDGLGLGLAIVKQYVKADFGGTIKVTSSRRQGTRFTVKLPICR